MRLLLCIALLLPTLVSSVHADLDRTGRRPPHYAGRPPAEPVRAVRGPLLTGRSFMEPGPSAGALEALAAVRPDVEALLDSLVGPAAAALGDGPVAGAPAVYVGALEGFYAPPRADGGDDVAPPRDAVWIHAQDTGGTWRRRARAAADSAGATHVIVVALELSDYPVSQKNWKGSKAVDLAAGHTVGVPWLTSLDQPAEVLQWTGALCRADGRLVRVGAEAFHAQRTPFGQSVLGVQRAITVEDLRAALAASREELPGSPPAWRVALVNLVAELTGKPRAPGADASQNR